MLEEKLFTYLELLTSDAFDVGSRLYDLHDLHPEYLIYDEIRLYSLFESSEIYERAYELAQYDLTCKHLYIEDDGRGIFSYENFETLNYELIDALKPTSLYVKINNKAIRNIRAIAELLQRLSSEGAVVFME